MFCCCGHACSQIVALQAVHIRAAHHGTERGVAAIGLVHPAPAQILGDIQHGGQRVAHCAHLAADGVSHGIHGLGREGCTETDGIWKQAGIRHDGPAQRFAMEQCGNPVVGVCHNIFLNFTQPTCKGLWF